MIAVWKELGFRSYNAYIKSRLWWSIRQIVLERDGKCCQVCGTPSKIVHHIDYTKIVMLGQGDQHELITLCEPCHNFVEQNKRVPEKKTLLNKLFGQHSKNTLDEWQVWAKQFNSDIKYNLERLFEHKHKSKKKLKPKKKQASNQLETIDKIKTEESPVETIRDQIDAYIQQHKKKKITKQKVTEKDIKDYLRNKDHRWLDNKVKYYNKLHEANIKSQLSKAFPYFIQLLLNHPNSSEKLKNCIRSYTQKNRPKETLQQKRDKKEAQYQKHREKKKAKLMGKLPVWTINHKAQSLQGKCPLRKHINEAKQKQNQEPPLDKTIPVV